MGKRGAPRRKSGVGTKIAIVVVILVVLIGGFVALYLSPLFAISDIQVSGNQKLQNEYVVELADVPDDSTFLRTDVEGITSRLMAEPWIQSADVERIFPGTLVLHIVEQPVAAVVDIVPETANDTTQRWAIAEDGTWIAQVIEGTVGTQAAEGTENTEASEGSGEVAEGAEGTESAEGEAESVDTSQEGTEGAEAAAESGEGTEGAEPAAEGGEGAQNVDGAGSAEDAGNDDLVGTLGVELSAEELVEVPKIKDVSAAVRPQAGERETDEGITNALALLAGFSDEMRAMVASISAPDAVKTTLTLYNNVGVAFGAAEDIEAKEKAIATLLIEHEGTITYINVRVADRATYRATEY